MEKTMQSVPQLEAPGAGLPFIEYLVAKYYYVKWLSRKETWEQSSARFQREGERILKIIAAHGPEQLTERKLVKRITGIEDSSRFWSIAMAVEHLMIVGSAIAKGLELAGKGLEIPGRTPSIADVKPQGSIDPKVLAEEFRAFLARYKDAVENKVENRDSGVRIAHPWFGPMTIRQWNWLMAGHQGIHRRQMDLIAQQLR